MGNEIDLTGGLSTYVRQGLGPQHNCDPGRRVSQCGFAAVVVGRQGGDVERSRERLSVTDDVARFEFAHVIGQVVG